MPASPLLVALDTRLRPLTAAAERTLPTIGAFEGLFPGGLPRGAMVRVEGSAARSCAFALLAQATRTGAWSCLIGLAHPGWRAAAELEVDLAVVVVVDPPATSPVPEIVAAAIDGFEVVVVGTAVDVGAAEVRRLGARARERGTVLLGVDEALPGRRARPVFPAGVADVVVRADSAGWSGLTRRGGRLDGRRVQVTAEGRRVPGRRQAVAIWLPDAAGAPRMAS